ncbi:peptidase S8 and S53 subtilisin kexin sedolisin [Catenulispora acidiphila DSM 44928]|uniref:Peptidase S8 and S53 subtilisin kexin sedolisin n=1 Tax=Catenulispora acidiphila (strain DSM 44928 / JCM 14897 / NBRC 102108 / NRRL B-24433 / ID139908) TaxID=479433 RepID=C7Q7Z0_CATAD|nr:S8/S53 family peptidase [Catenulispora acidiphila]ACU74157.1 peptidase S8 and S53 subtilisin kexin sedolisin [Catenulispora acidiphila DSM 44928]
MTDHAARMARILETHQDVVHVGGSTEALIKRDELLVLGAHADAVHEQARQWVDSREDFAELGVSRLRLRAGAGVDAADLTHSLRGGAGAHRRTSVTPNHVMSGAPNWTGGPFGAPTPAADLPAPVDAEGGGRRATIGILDTGIDPHPWFAEADWYQACTETEHEDLDPASEDDLESDSGHGTFIAGVILQHAPGTYLRVQRVLGTDGVTDELELLHGLRRLHARAAAESNRLDVLNLSLGCFTFDDRPSPVLADAFARVARHSVIVAAAGNHSSDRPYWPAALKDVVAVAALAQADTDGPERASFSNYGWWVDASAPGEKVSSSFLTHGRENGEDFHGFATWSGTSFAAPYVAGKIAALMSAKDMTARDALSELLDPANTRIPDLGVVVASDGR